MSGPLIYGEATEDETELVVIADGADEDVAYAARLLPLLTPHFKTSDPPGALVTALTWTAVVQLSTQFGEAWKTGPRLTDWTLAELLRRTSVDPTNPGELTNPPPAGMTPRDYQVAGAKLIAATGSAFLFDEPRTGKTITTILGLVESAATGRRVLPVLIVCPASVVDPWVEELGKWAPQWSAVAWRGTPERRRGLMGHHDIYVTSYETARRDAQDKTQKRSPLMHLHHNTVVCDEQHRLKNSASAQSRAVRRLSKDAHFIGLSGTPITHSPKDAWGALAAMTADSWPSSERWTARYCLQGRQDYGEDILGFDPHTVEEFWTCLLGQWRRVARADVMSQLPPKIYSVRTVQMPEKYRAAYDALEQTMLTELPDGGGELSVMGVLAQFQHLSIMACAAGDVELTHEIVWDDEAQCEVEKTHTHINLRKGDEADSWKVDALLEVLDERRGEAVAVFATSRQLVELAGEKAEKAGYRVGYIKGGQSQKQRTAYRKAFQAGELDVICVVTQAGGVGITLSRAGTLVFLQRPWSLIDSLQAEDRGEGDLTQTNGTEIIDILTSNTIETRVRQVLKERAGQLSDFVKDRRIVEQLLGGDDVSRSKIKAKVAA